jgi:pimeloyl-ACP methyl ester carboxylesterase
MSYAAVNSLNMYFEDHGEGAPLLLLHGGSGTAEYFSEAVPYFADRFRVIVVEFMGHGRTGDDGDRWFHYHDMAEDIVEFMRVLGIESASILGYSDGGIVGLDMAIHHPDLVRKLAVTGANSRVDGYTAEAQESARTFVAGEAPVPEAYARLSPDGADHWPVFLGRLQRMWLVEPSFTAEQRRELVPRPLDAGGAGDQSDRQPPRKQSKPFRA